MTPVTIICALLAIFTSEVGTELWTCCQIPRTSRCKEVVLSIAALLKVFQARSLFVFDPTAMQSILVKDQNIYEEHKDSIAMNSLVFGPGILSTRATTPEISQNYDPRILHRESPKNGSMFYEVVQRSRGLQTRIWLPVLPAIAKIPPRCAKSATSRFYECYCLEPRQERKEAIRNGTLEVKDDAKDIMSLLTRRVALTDEELVASTSIIIFAATDTTSSSLNRLLHIMHKIRTYKTSFGRKFSPTRKPWIMTRLWDYPISMPLSVKQCDYIRLLPSGNPPTLGRHRFAPHTPVTGLDGTIMDTINVPKGTLCYIAIGASNHDKQVWGEDALEFRPERWVNGKADGFKFSQLEMSEWNKVVLCVLLRAFKFSQPDPRIKWLKGDPIQAPHVDNEPRLPIVVERLKI
ncbi:cytochrome P450 [Mycena leptocephala]|nr:cytochrome P450 [Mycena leptocephala]